MHPVSSSAVAQIGYDPRAQEVHVEFEDGDVYAYESVPHVIWRAFEAAPSKGGFVNRVLKPSFRCRKLTR